jgi:hypothetical protein
VGITHRYLLGRVGKVLPTLLSFLFSYDEKGLSGFKIASDKINIGTNREKKEKVK